MCKFSLNLFKILAYKTAPQMLAEWKDKYQKRNHNISLVTLEQFKGNTPLDSKPVI